MLLFALALAGGGVWRLSLSQRAAEMVTDTTAMDPEERARLLSLLPRADERRHLRRSADEIPAA